MSALRLLRARTGGPWGAAIRLGVRLATVGMAANAVSEVIPPLRPPRAGMPPGFWERNGWTVLALGLFLALLCLAARRVLRRCRRATEQVPLDVATLGALEALRGQPEDGRVLSEISRLVRRYFVAALALPPAERTNRELGGLLCSDQRVGLELAKATAGFLDECDQRRFSPSGLGGEGPAVEQALDLIKSAMARLRSAPGPTAADAGADSGSA